MGFPDKFRLDGKTAVVTGGAGLIGAALCRGLAESGAKVYIAEADMQRAHLLKKRLSACGHSIESIKMDIARVSSIISGIKKIKKTAQKIDIWINNAYPRTSDWGQPFEKVQPLSLKKNIDSHMNGYFHCCQKIFTVMKNQKSGVIVNIGSHYGVLGPNFSVYKDTAMTMPAAYALIKGGIVNFSRYLATYGAAHHIRVNAVCPGGVYNKQDKRFVARYKKLIPCGRMALPDDVVGPVVFLCSDAASYMTGQVVMVDGGLSAW